VTSLSCSHPNCTLTKSTIGIVLLIAALHFSLDQRDFLEVQTPMMNKIAGGATAKPFKTYVSGVLIILCEARNDLAKLTYSYAS
jgi:hypothetical protein